jgi:hypothetical protein
MIASSFESFAASSAAGMGLLEQPDSDRAAPLQILCESSDDLSAMGAAQIPYAVVRNFVGNWQMVPR